MHKDGWYFFWTFQPPINWCEKGKKFAVFIMSARYSRKILVYILIHLIKNARGAVFIRHMCKYELLLKAFCDVELISALLFPSIISTV